MIQLDMTIDMNCSVGNFTDKTFCQCRGQKYPTDITKIGIPTLFLLEYKKVSGRGILRA
jgi:hypothetical protein